VSVSMSHVRGFWKLSGDPWFSLHIYFWKQYFRALCAEVGHSQFCFIEEWSVQMLSLEATTERNSAVSYLLF
jgi:hypothetical protein